MNDLQTKLFDNIRQRAQNPKRWIDEVADVLRKSKHTIYKKIQGESCLSLDEVVTLASHYQLHLDPMIRPGTVLSFEFPSQNHCRHYGEHLSQMRAQLELAEKLPDVQIWHAGIELPWIHDHGFPELVAFKFFIHNKTVWEYSNQSPEQFDLVEAQNDVHFEKELREILQKYYQFPTIEIWNGMILDITLSQIRYALQSHMLTQPEDALSLCDVLDTFITHMEQMAECGYKCLPGERAGGDFELYHNEIAHTINILLLQSGYGDMLYLGFTNPQYIYSHSNAATESAEHWLRMLRSNATPITRESRKERLVFFTMLRKKVARARAEIEVILKMNAL